MEELSSYASVRAWLADYARHWGSDDPELPQKLRVLQEFCQLIGNDPDAIVGECLREVEGGKRIRPKARRRYIAAINEFEAGHQGGRAAGNVVRSFLVHNGVALSADILRE